MTQLTIDIVCVGLAIAMVMTFDIVKYLIMYWPLQVFLWLFFPTLGLIESDLFCITSSTTTFPRPFEVYMYQAEIQYTWQLYPGGICLPCLSFPYQSLPSMAGQHVLTIWSSFWVPELGYDSCLNTVSFDRSKQAHAQTWHLSSKHVSTVTFNIIGSRNITVVWITPTIAE